MTVEFEKNLSTEDAVAVINQRQRQMLVHSYIYYQKNDSIVSDYDFDRWANELVALQAHYPEARAKSVYADEFRNFDGSSGFDLPYMYPKVMNTAEHLLKHCGRPSLF